MRTFAASCFAAIAASISVEPFAKELAQTQGRAHNCHSTADRNKMLGPDFTEWRNGNYRYRDLEFDHNNDALYWADMNESPIDGVDPQEVQWKRAYSAFTGKGRTLFGDGITPDDVNQGALGNCWFLSGASAIAEIPGRMEKIFLNKEKELNPQGVYGINLYSLGVPHTIMVDDFLPLFDRGDGQLATMFSKAGDDGSMWTAIIEKAFAKYHGNYAHIEGGDPGRAVAVLTGGPIVNYDHKKISADDLWEKLLAHDQHGDIMTCVSPPGSDKTTDATGLVQGHAFTLIGAKKLSNGVRMLTIRNPHGREHYHGNWSDKDPRWTASLKAEAGMKEDMEDGTFRMAIEDFMYLFVASRAVLYPENMGYDYFLMLNDNSKPGGYGSCGKSCTRHKLTVLSEVDQDVYVTFHAEDGRDISKSCKTTKQKSKWWQTPAKKQSFGGSSNTQSWSMKKGQKSAVTIEIDFSNDSFAKDWSVVAHGASGPVHVYHNAGWRTQHMPLDKSGPPAPTRPELPAYDYSPFMNWISAKGAQQKYAGDVYVEEHEDHEWVALVNHSKDTFNFDFQFQMAADEWNDAKYTVSNLGKNLKDVAQCDGSDGWSQVCTLRLGPGQMAGFVVEPPFTSRGIGYVSNFSRI